MPDVSSADEDFIAGQNSIDEREAALQALLGELDEQMAAVYHRSTQITDGSAHRSLWLSEHRVWSTPPASTRPTQLFSTRTPMWWSDEQSRCENAGWTSRGRAGFRIRQRRSQALSAPTACPESRRLPQPRLAGPSWKPETAGLASMSLPER